MGDKNLPFKIKKGGNKFDREQQRSSRFLESSEDFYPHYPRGLEKAG